MAVIAHVILRGVSPEQYDAVRAEVGWLESTPDGGLAHPAWGEGGDNHNIDAWESEAAFGASVKVASVPPWPSSESTWRLR